MSSTAGVVIDVVAMHGDARGAVFEPLNATELQAQRNTHVVLSEPGAVRGNHYHRVGQETTVVVGPAIVCYRATGDSAPVQEVLVPAGSAQRFTFPAGVVHAFRNPGPGVMILASFNTELHNAAAPDVVREVIIPVT